MSEHDPNNDGIEAALRWIAEQAGRSVERLQEVDIDQIAHAAGVDADRAKEFLDEAGQWLNDQAEHLVTDATQYFGGLAANRSDHAARHGAGPHPLDLPSAAQGLALSALDSGRWTVEPGSNVLAAHGEGAAPADALGLVGELRARDWINAEGEVTVVGRDALKRWMRHAEAT